ncbi:MAG: DsbE family thiol:disulfide interchange protein [Gammaproteobacteria bacterium]
MARYLLPLALFAVLLGLLYAGLSRDPRLVPSPLIGKPVPAFSLPRLKAGESPLTQRDLHGQPTLVNIWASWCAACRDEHPLLIELAERDDIRILGLNYKDTRVAAQDWLDKWGDPYADVAYDEAGRVAIDWGVYGVPETFVVDADGIIRYKQVGPLTEPILSEQLLPALRAAAQTR